MAASAFAPTTLPPRWRATAVLFDNRVEDPGDEEAQNGHLGKLP